MECCNALARLTQTVSIPVVETDTCPSASWLIAPHRTCVCFQLRTSPLSVTQPKRPYRTSRTTRSRNIPLQPRQAPNRICPQQMEEAE